MGVFAPLTGIIGAMQAAEALKLIAGAGEVASAVSGCSTACRWNGAASGSARIPSVRCQVCRGAAAGARDLVSEAGQQAQIGTERAQIANDQPALVGQRFERRQVEHAARRIAEQTGRQVEQQFVDQACAQQ
jgi:hypothetical protein